MRYFTLTGNDHYTYKNGYHKDVAEFLRNESQKILESKEQALIHKAQIIDVINTDLKAKHPRCKPFDVWAHESHFNAGGFTIVVPGVANITYYVERV